MPVFFLSKEFQKGRNPAFADALVFDPFDEISRFGPAQWVDIPIFGVVAHRARVVAKIPSKITICLTMIIATALAVKILDIAEIAAVDGVEILEFPSVEPILEVVWVYVDDV